MKDFLDFSKEIRNLISGSSYNTQNSNGKLGAYGLTKTDIYNAGYSLDGYAPRGLNKLVVLPKKVFLREHFLQDKLFIILCRLMKTKIREHSKNISGSMPGDFNLSESGIIASAVFCSIDCITAVSETISFLTGNAKKNRISSNVSYYNKMFSGYDFTSLK